MPLSDMQESGIVGRTDVFRVDPRKIVVIEGWNPRQDYDLAELKESIRANGVKMPLLVRRNKDKHFELVDGERRLRAAMELIDEGCEIVSVPCLSEHPHTSQADLLINALIANQGKPFTPLEEAEAFRRFISWGWDTPQLVARLGRSHEYIRSRLTLNEAAPVVVQAVKNGELPVTHAVNVIRESHKSGERQEVVLEQQQIRKATQKRQQQATKSAARASGQGLSETDRKVFAVIDYVGVGGVLSSLSRYCELHDRKDLASLLREMDA